MYNTWVMAEKISEKRRGVLPSTLSAMEVLSKGGAGVKAWPHDETHDLVTVKKDDKVIKLKLGNETITEISGLDVPEILDPEL